MRSIINQKNPNFTLSTNKKDFNSSVENAERSLMAWLQDGKMIDEQRYQK